MNLILRLWQGTHVPFLKALNQSYLTKIVNLEITSHTIIYSFLFSSSRSFFLVFTFRQVLNSSYAPSLWPVPHAIFHAVKPILISRPCSALDILYHSSSNLSGSIDPWAEPSLRHQVNITTQPCRACRVIDSMSFMCMIRISCKLHTRISQKPNLKLFSKHIKAYLLNTTT